MDEPVMVIQTHDCEHFESKSYTLFAGHINYLITVFQSSFRYFRWQNTRYAYGAWKAFMPLLPMGGEHCVFRSSVRPSVRPLSVYRSVNSYFA